MVREFALLMALVAAGSTAAAEPAPTQLDCAYSPRHVGDIVTFKNCATVDASGAVQLAPKHRLALRYDRYGLASLWLGKNFYYVSRQGALAPVETLDNDADPFNSGLARSPQNGKIGYVDRSLRLVIPARYDGAYPFEHGRAVVCRGCLLENVDRSGEYQEDIGGLWGCIDTKGREVVPLTNPSHAAAGC